MLSGLMRWLGQAGICAVVGSLAGAFTGMVFGLSLLYPPSHRVPLWQALLAGAVLGFIAWLVILCLLLLMGHYALNSVLNPSFVTCLIVGVATAWIVNLVHLPYLGMLIGWIAGFLIGRLFCVACESRVVGAHQ